MTARRKRINPIHASNEISEKLREFIESGTQPTNLEIYEALSKIADAVFFASAAAEKKN